MIPIVLYARSDVAGIAIPVESGGCGQSHSRPVIKGAPAKVFELDCPPCESYLRGDRRQKKLVYQTHPKTGQVTHQDRVADADPMWSSTPETVPLTPDETRTNEVRSERGKMQIEMLQALAALRSTGVDVPPEAMWLLERELPAGVLQGTKVCANGHDAPAGSAFCPQCGVSMAARGVLETASPEPEGDGPELDLARLHPQTLKKLCRQRDLPDTGSRDELIARLAA